MLQNINVSNQQNDSKNKEAQKIARNSKMFQKALEDTAKQLQDLYDGEVKIK